MKLLISLSGFILCLLFTTSNANAVECPRACDNIENCRRTYSIGSKTIDYYSNFPLTVQNNCIESVIFVVHGTERNAASRYDAMLDAAKSVEQERRVLIISPYFKTDDDNPRQSEYYWSSSGWKQGNTSNNNGPDISSFSVADNILGHVIDDNNFPFLTRATVTGHSAGGQYTQMYALTTTLPSNHPVLDFQFLVLNPSNYTYLNTSRPYPGATGEFDIPVYFTGSSWRMKSVYRDAAGNCPNDFNDYKYGLQERNLYANRLSSSALINQYLPRKVYYVLGELDNDPDHDSLDTSCEAMLQGFHRLERGQNYFDFLNQFFSWHNHEILTVPGVGHSARDMYNDEEVKVLLFGV